MKVSKVKLSGSAPSLPPFPAEGAAEGVVVAVGFVSCTAELVGFVAADVAAGADEAGAEDWAPLPPFVGVPFPPPLMSFGPGIS